MPDSTGKGGLDGSWRSGRSGDWLRVGGGYVDMYSLGSDMRILGLGLLSLKIK